MDDAPFEHNLAGSHPIASDIVVRVSGAPASFVAAQLASGRYADAGAVVAAALLLLEDEEEAEAWKEARFEQLIEEGDADLAAGRYVTLAPEEVKSWLERLGRDPSTA